MAHTDLGAHVQVDADLIWRAVLSDLQGSLPASAFEWLRQTQLTGFATDDIATIRVSDRVTAETLNRRFKREIERALAARVGRPVEAAFQSQAHDAPSGPSAALPRGQTGERVTPTTARPLRLDMPPDSNGAESGKPTQMSLAPSRALGLNPKYVLRTYVVGAGNRFAHAAGVSVAEHPGGKYNPLFIHGGVGLGKTHLLHAVGHRTLDLHDGLQVAYVTSEKFTNDLIAAIRQQRTDEFRARYREIDVLMIDDIQFIAGKESTQEEFFHTFNALYQSGKQVIISSDKPPKAISALEERLRSRFEGGLIADVQLPDYEMRLAILRIKDEE